MHRWLVIIASLFAPGARSLLALRSPVVVMHLLVGPPSPAARGCSLIMRAPTAAALSSSWSFISPPGRWGRRGPSPPSSSPSSSGQTRSFRRTGVLNLNRFLFDPSELDDRHDDPDGGNWTKLARTDPCRPPTVTLPATDYRTVHAAKVLNLQNGDTIRAGVVGGGWIVGVGGGGGGGSGQMEGNDNSTAPGGGGLVTDEAVVTWLPEGKIKKAQPTRLGKPPGSLRVSLESLRPPEEGTGGDGGDDEVRVSLLLALPRPLQLGRILPVVAQMGVDHLVLCSARKVPRDYFGSHLFRRQGELRRRLVEGLCQAGDDARLPRVTVVKKLRPFIEDGELDKAFPPESVARVIAHPHRRSATDVAPLRMRDVRFPGEDESSSGGRRHQSRRMILAVGPEGGWEEGDELDMFRRRGFQQVTLGRRVLRSDVAVISLLALARDVCDDGGGARPAGDDGD